jgi:hypothetical protein
MRYTSTLCFLAILALPLASHGAAKDAVIRIPSHGGSGTIIYTSNDYSLILTASHLFWINGDTPQVDPRLLAKKPTLDIPEPVKKPGTVYYGAKVIAIDVDADVALWKVNIGNLPYGCPVAPAGFRPGPNILSCGYDNMKLPGSGPQAYRATILSSDQDTTYTREKPWHGRSGGALIDADAGYVIGVVGGYETKNGGRGIYASHAAILRLMIKAGVSLAPQPVQPKSPQPYVAQPKPESSSTKYYIDIPKDCRILNRSGSQCWACAIETLARKHGITALYTATREYQNAGGPDTAYQLFSRHGIPSVRSGTRGPRYQMQMPGSRDMGLVTQACKHGLGAAVGIPGHMFVVCGIDESEDTVWIIDNGGPKAGQVVAKSLKGFKHYFDRWVIVLLPGDDSYTPQSLPPSPGQVYQPRPQQRPSPQLQYHYDPFPQLTVPCPGGS